MDKQGRLKYARKCVTLAIERLNIVKTQLAKIGEIEGLQIQTIEGLLTRTTQATNELIEIEFSLEVTMNETSRINQDKLMKASTPMEESFTVELHSTEPSAVNATRNTIEHLGGILNESNGVFYVTSPHPEKMKFLRFACERQGYVKRVIG